MDDAGGSSDGKDRTRFEIVPTRIIDILAKTNKCNHALARTQEDTKQLLEFTKSNSLIRQFPEESQLEFTNQMSLRLFRKNEVIFFQGDQVTHESSFYILLSGRVTVHINKTFEEERLAGESYLKFCKDQQMDESFLGKEVATLPVLATFGENLGGDERSASIRAEEDLYCASTKLSVFRQHQRLHSDTIIRNEYIQQLLESDPSTKTESECRYLADFLLQIRFFRPLPSIVREKIVRHTYLKKVPKHAVISVEGGDNDYIWIILSGSVNLYSEKKHCSTKFHRNSRKIHHRTVHSDDSHSTSSGSEHDHGSEGSGSEEAQYRHPSSEEDDEIVGEEAGGNKYLEQFENEHGNRISTLVCGDSFGHHALSEVIGKSSMATALTIDHCEFLCIHHDIYKKTMKIYEDDLHFSVGSCMNALRTFPRRRNEGQNHLIEEFLTTKPLQAFFEQIPPILREQIAEVVKLKHFEELWTVYEQHQSSRNFYVILSGSINLYDNDVVTSYDGTDLVTSGRSSRFPKRPAGPARATYVPGDTFGQSELLSDTENSRKSTALCMEACDILVVPKRYFCHVFKSIVSTEHITFNPSSCRLHLMEDASQRGHENIRDLALYCQQTIRFFSTLSIDSVEELVKRFSYHIYPPLSPIILEGDQGGVAYIVVRGECSVHVKGERIQSGMGRGNILKSYSTKEAVSRRFGVLVAKIGPGDSFGEQAMAKNLEKSHSTEQGTTLRTASIISESEVHLIAITHDDYQHFVQTQHGTFGNVSNALKVLRKTPESRDHNEIKLLMRLSSSNSFLNQLTVIQREALCKVFGLRSAEKGELICLQGDRAQSMYIIISGTVKVWVKRDDRKDPKVIREEVERSNRVKQITRRFIKKLHRRSLLAKRSTGKTLSLARSALANFRPKSFYDVIDPAAVFGKNVATLHSGDAFGEIALQGPADTRRSATVAAGVGGAELLVVNRPDFDRMLRVANVEFQAKLLQEKLDAAEKDNENSDVLSDLILATMRQLSLFNTFERESKEQLSKLCKYKTVPSETLVFQHQEESDQIYIICEGEVDILNEDQQVVYQTVKNGEMFGHQETVLSPLSVGFPIPRIFTAKATKQTRMLVISREDFVRYWPNVENMTSAFAFLSGLPFLENFATLAPGSTQRMSALTDIAILAILSSQSHHIRGEYLSRQGLPAENLIIIKSGTCQISVKPNTRENKGIPLTKIGRGGVLGFEKCSACTARIHSTTLEAIVISKYDLIHKVSSRIVRALRRFLAQTRMWRATRLEDVKNAEGRLPLQDHVLTKAKKATVTTQLRTHCVPPNRFAAKSKPCQPHPVVPVQRRTLRASKAQRPFSSTGRRSEIQWGDWQTKDPSFVTCLDGKKIDDRGNTSAVSNVSVRGHTSMGLSSRSSQFGRSHTPAATSSRVRRPNTTLGRPLNVRRRSVARPNSAPPGKRSFFRKHSMIQEALVEKLLQRRPQSPPNPFLCVDHDDDAMDRRRQWLKLQRQNADDSLSGRLLQVVQKGEV